MKARNILQSTKKKHFQMYLNTGDTQNCNLEVVMYSRCHGVCANQQMKLNTVTRDKASLQDLMNTR